MKKKHRDITVDSIKYGWIVEPHASIKCMTVLKVYKDKKVWFTITSLGTVFPSDVRKFIEFQFKKDGSIPTAKSPNTPSEWKVVKS